MGNFFELLPYRLIPFILCIIFFTLVLDAHSILISWDEVVPRSGLPVTYGLYAGKCLLLISVESITLYLSFLFVHALDHVANLHTLDTHLTFSE